MFSKSTSQREGHECLFRTLLGFLPGPYRRIPPLPLTSGSSDPASPSLGSCEQPAENVGTDLAQPGARRQYYSSTSQQLLVGMFQNHQRGPGAMKAWKHHSYLSSLTYFQSTKCQRQVPGMRSYNEASIGILDYSTQHSDVLSPKEHGKRQMDFFSFQICHGRDKQERALPKLLAMFSLPTKFLKFHKFPREATPILPGQALEYCSQARAASSPSRLPAQGQAKVSPRNVGWVK